MVDHLATKNMGRILGVCVPFVVEQLGSHVTQCGLRRGLPSYQVASWSMQPFGHNRHGPKIGGSAPFLGRGSWIAGSPSNTMSLRLRPTFLPSGTLIQQSIWPQHWDWGGLCRLGGGDLGLRLTQCGQDRGLPACQVSSWSVNRLAAIYQGDMSWMGTQLAYGKGHSSPHFSAHVYCSQTACNRPQFTQTGNDDPAQTLLGRGQK